jgi:DNA-binding XRE family transcriptional regulator
MFRQFWKRSLSFFLPASKSWPDKKHLCHFEFDMSDITITDPISLGAALRKTRRAMKLSQEELSLQAGISRPTIRAIEQGKETSHIGLALQLCRDLGMTLTATLPDEARNG